MFVSFRGINDSSQSDELLFLFKLFGNRHDGDAMVWASVCEGGFS